MANGSINILFDIGGTKTRVAAASKADDIEEPLLFDTEVDYGKGLEALKEKIETAARGRRIKSIVGGIAGMLAKDRSRLFRSHHLLGWEDKSLVEDLLETFKAPMRIENDAALSALGEAVFGAGREHEIVAYITVSTGVGGARVVRRTIDEHMFGFEPGQQIMDIGSMRTLEDLVSGSAVEKGAGMHPSKINDPAFWDGIAGALAVGLTNTIAHWSPDVVILGGAMIRKRPGISIGDVRRHLEAVPHIYPELPLVKKAELDDVGGLYGALALASRRNGKAHAS